jgi:hypothetical protein
VFWKENAHHLLLRQWELCENVDCRSVDTNGEIARLRTQTRVSTTKSAQFWPMLAVFYFPWFHWILFLHAVICGHHHNSHKPELLFYSSVWYSSVFTTVVRVYELKARAAERVDGVKKRRVVSASTYCSIQDRSFRVERSTKENNVSSLSIIAVLDHNSRFHVERCRWPRTGFWIEKKIDAGEGKIFKISLWLLLDP